MWIALSELAVGHWFPEGWTRALADMGKDSSFVIITAFLLFHVVKRLEHRRHCEVSECEKAAAAIEEHRLRLEGIVNSAMDGIITIDQNQNIVVFNPAAERMFRCRKADVIGKTIDQFIPQRLRAGHAVSVCKFACEGITSRNMGHFGGVVGLRSDGHEFPLEASISRLELGKVLFLTVFCRDISDRTAAEQLRKNLEAQLRQAQKLEAIGQLAGGVAHDFNNLLTVINGNASLLMDLGTLHEEEIHLAKQVIEASQHAASLTRQLLMFSRKQPLRLADLDLNDIVQKMTRMLHRILGEDITLHANYLPDLPPLHGDIGMMEQIVLNLAVNARDAMPSGGSICISTSLQEFNEADLTLHPDSSTGKFVCLSVTDTGTGIAPENLPHIFEPFYTTKDINKGTGLGLATVYGVVKQHQGWIEVTSKVGQGSIFSIYLPALATPRPAQPGEETPPNLPQGKETILVVEDEPALRILVYNVLQRCGYTVLTADSGKDAIRQWNANRSRIDLLLTDIVMPGGMTGTQLSEQLLADKEGLKVILTSGYSPETAGQSSNLLGRHPFLAKPYSPAQLAQCIRAVLDRKDWNPASRSEPMT